MWWMTEALILCKRFAAWRLSLKRYKRPAHVRKLRVTRLLVHIVMHRARAAFALLSLLRTEIHFVNPRDASLRTNLITDLASNRSNTTLRHHVLQATLCFLKIHFFTIRINMWRCVACMESSMRRACVARDQVAKARPCWRNRKRLSESDLRRWSRRAASVKLVRWTRRRDQVRNAP